MDKTALRKTINQKRLALSKEICQSKSLSCFENTKALINQLEFNSIGIYMDARNEMNTRLIINYLWSLHKDVYIPKCERNGIMHFHKIGSFDDVKMGYFQILEPTTTIVNNQLDVMIIPLVSINSKGYRLGMGGGYYDRFVSKYPTLKIGIGYEFQKQDFIHEDHDLKFDYYITENTITTY